jgi:GWxTD domain-containing protein
MMFRVRFLGLGLLLLFAPLSLRAVDSARTLSPEFRHWLEEDAAYIITTEERKNFLSLANDTERENFIQSFWEARNPDPHSEVNTFKEEHYRRLAYANGHFGNVKAQDGWHTDQGMIYILLGEPKQIANYPAARNVRPIQIWFYQGGEHPSLPSHFYVLFYKRSIGEQYTLYSPYQDGPVRLVTGLESLNDQVRSLKQIRASLGDEVARTTLSLLPSEPVNLDDYSPSLQSDQMLSTIRGLADNPYERQKLALTRSRENVTASIFTQSTAIDVVTMPVRDPAGRSTVFYLVRNQAPDPSLIGGKQGNGYDMTLRTTVAAGGKPVYEQQEVLKAPLAADAADSYRKEMFAAEGRLPLVPGTYDVEVTLTNNLNLQAHRWRNRIEVPAPRLDKLQLSNLLVYRPDGVTPDSVGQLPFSLAGVRFHPQAAGTVTVHSGDRIPLVFQIWLPHQPNTPPAVKAVHLHYLYGSVASGEKPIEESTEEVETTNADADGNLVTGHTVDIGNPGLGSYRLVVQATADGYPTPAFATLNVRVVPPEMPVAQWTAHAGEQTPAQSADDLKRGLAAEALGQDAQAEALYRSALKTDPAQLRALVRLADVLSREKKAQELGTLADTALAGFALPPETLMQIARALRDTGGMRQAIRFLNAQFQLQSPTAPMYELLASIYDSQGDRNQAATLREHAKKVAPKTAPAPAP